MVPPLRLTVVEHDAEPADADHGKKFTKTWPRGLPDMRSAG
jgi:hypothetical protein